VRKETEKAAQQGRIRGNQNRSPSRGISTAFVQDLVALRPIGAANASEDEQRPHVTAGDADAG